MMCRIVDDGRVALRGESGPSRPWSWGPRSRQPLSVLVRHREPRIALACGGSGCRCGLWRARTADLFRVKEMLYQLS